MNSAIISSGSLSQDDFGIPHWAKPTIFFPIDVGCLARVLPIGGPTWANELVIVLEVVESGSNFTAQQKKFLNRYRVFGRLGETTLPQYALDVQT